MGGWGGLISLTTVDNKKVLGAFLLFSLSVCMFVCSVGMG